MEPRFLQLHTLTSYPSSLLNRDDAGFAKRITFGGRVRTRISSQCLKRHWRTYEGEEDLNSLDIPSSIRSRHTFEKFVLEPLLEGDGAPTREVAVAVVQALAKEVLGSKQDAKKGAKKDAKKDDEKDIVRTEQVTVLGRPEVDYLLNEAREIAAGCVSVKDVPSRVKERCNKDWKANLKALRHAAGWGAALFGRMVTSDILSRGDAAVHVAHAFTVHEEYSESDYFSAVDDLHALEETAELGSGHINSAELTTGLFYGYAVVDVPLLVSNLEGCDRRQWLDADRGLAAEILRRLILIISRVSPGAKLGSTAPYAYSHLVLAEAGRAQPRTLANAFLDPVAARTGHLVQRAYESLAAHASDLDRMYGTVPRRCLAALGPSSALSSLGDGHLVESVRQVADWAAEQVRGA